jgi:hypothetical protein
MKRSTVPAHPKGPGEVTLADIKRYPRYYIAGPGRAAADRSYCEHRYLLTASCPLCP